MSSRQDKEFDKDANAQTEEQRLDSEIYKCQNCGNFLHYDPTSGKLKCDYCKTFQPVKVVESAVELPYRDDVEEEFESWQGVKSVKCKSCGAITVLP